MRRPKDPFPAQGRVLQRFTDTRIEDEMKLAKILIETGAETRPSLSLLQADPQDLRGIPCIAMGVGGTSPGTDPLRAVLRRDAA